MIDDGAAAPSLTRCYTTASASAADATGYPTLSNPPASTLKIKSSRSIDTASRLDEAERKRGLQPKFPAISQSCIKAHYVIY